MAKKVKALGGTTPMAKFRINVGHGNHRVGDVIELPVDDRRAVLGVKSKRLSLLDEPAPVEHTKKKATKTTKATKKATETKVEELHIQEPEFPEIDGDGGLDF